MTDPVVLVVMGVSGVGKTTIAVALADRLGWDRGEGDDLHPIANIERMRAGVPLTDEDRWPWLARVAEWIAAHLDHGESGVITCSALRRAYRDRLRRPGVVFVHLVAGSATIQERISDRRGHYMPPSLLGSQLQLLEPLQPDETGFVVSVEGRAPEQVVDDILARLG